jgi:hypothetical protein
VPDEPTLWNGEYEKQFYWVHLPDGTRVECWPNAGIMNATDGSGRMWRPADKVMITVQAGEDARFYSAGRVRKPAGDSVLHATGHGLVVESMRWTGGPGERLLRAKARAKKERRRNKGK